MATTRSSFKDFTRAQKAPWWRRFGYGNDESVIDYASSNNYAAKSTTFDQSDDVEEHRIDTDSVLQIGGEAVYPMRMSETIYITAPTGTPSQSIFMAMFPCTITGISCDFDVTNGAALTGQITHESGTQAPAAGTAVLTTAFNLNGTARKTQIGVIPNKVTGSPSVKSMATGDRLSILFSTAITSLAGLAITIYFQPGSKGHVAYLRQNAAAGQASQVIFLANSAQTIQGISAIWSAAGTDAGAVTLDITKDTGTTAPGGGTTCLSATISLKGTANTVNAASLTATVATLTMAAGDRIAFKLTGTPTTLAGLVIAVWFTAEASSRRKEVMFNVGANAAIATQPFFVADQRYEIIDNSFVAPVAATGGAATLAVTIDGDTVAAGGGLLPATVAFDLTTTANTVVIATPDILRKRILPKNGRLSVKLTGATTSMTAAQIAVSLRAQG